MTAPETPDGLRARIADAARNRAGDVTEHSWQIADAVLPLFDALLARLTAAEADADRLAHDLEQHSYEPNWPEYRIEALRLHDEAVALRERQQ